MARSKRKGYARNRVKFQWSKELIFFLIGLGICIALMVFCLIPTKQQRFYNKWYSSSNSLQLDNVFEEVSYKKLKKNIEKNADNDELIYVYYATEQDSTSVTNIGILDHYTNKYEKSNDDTHYDIDTIYVYNAKEAYELNTDDDDEVDALEEKEDWFNDHLGADIEEISLTSYAQLWIFQGGEMVYSSATLLADEQGSDQGSNFTLAAIKFLSYSLTTTDAKYSYL